LSSGESVDIEYRVNPKKDFSTWAWVQADPIVVDGDVVRITGFSRDVTDRRRRERQLYVMDTLLRHNLRNDLTIMLGNAAQVADAFPDAAEFTDTIRDTGEALLDSADKEREIIELLIEHATPVPIELTRIVDEAVASTREAFPAATVDVDAPGELTVVGLDELVLAIEELLENAIIHTDEPAPHVSVTVEQTADTATVTLRDDAPAMPAIEAGVLTGEYQMSDVYHSSGLGLWLVHWILDLADGTITVTEREHGGNEITLTLDRAEH
jgi:signal transduction histidine kinase